MVPQHWLSAVQLPGVSRQHTDVAAEGRHDSPSQHSAARMHGPGAARQVLAGRTQARLGLHKSPAPQGVPALQQPWFSRPQGGDTQAPASQRIPTPHAPPQRPQCRASLASAAHTPPQQVAPAPVHASPAQQGCPDAPQGPAAGSQRPDRHASPAMQAFSDGQQVWAWAPQPADGRQRNDTQA